MAAENNPIQGPFGDIVIADTPYTDMVLQRLYQEQKTRQAAQQKEAADLDKMMADDVGKIRSVDQADYIKSYSDYKTLRKKLLFDKTLDNDPYARAFLQNQATKALSDLKTLATKSAEIKKEDESLIGGRMKNPDMFVDDFYDLYNVRRNTPVKHGGKIKLGEEEVDVFDPGTYNYKGTNTDFGKLLKDAGGTPKVVFSEQESVDEQNLQSKITPYKYGNTPAQVKAQLLGSFATHKVGRDVPLELKKISKEQAADIEKKYNEIPEEQLKRMGISERQDLRPTNPDNEADVLSSLMAMRYAVDNAPVADKPSVVTNIGNVEALRQRNRMQMERARAGNARELATLKQSFKKLNNQEQRQWLDEFVNAAVENAKSSGAQPYMPKGGGVFDTYEIQLSPTLKKALGNADSYRITPEGDVMYIEYDRYPEGDDNAGKVKVTKDGKRAVNTDLSGRMSLQEFKALVGKQMLGVKATNEQLDVEDFDDGEEVEEEVQVTTTPSPVKKKTATPAKKKTTQVEDLRSKYNY